MPDFPQTIVDGDPGHETQHELLWTLFALVNTDGPLSMRPAAGVARRTYFATDTEQWFRDDGTEWHEMLMAKRFAPSDSAAFIDIRSQGAVADNGATNNSVPINAAVGLLGANGGTVVVPKALQNFDCADVVNISNLWSIVIQGRGSVTGGASSASSLRYTGTGARFIDSRGSAGNEVNRVFVGATSASFAGVLVDYGGLTGKDSYACQVDDCTIDPGALGSGVNLNKANGCLVRRSNFVNQKYGVTGSAPGSTTYSNGNTVELCRFGGTASTGWGIFGLGQAWNIRANLFEERADGSAGAVNDNVAGGAPQTGALALTGNWCGDVVNGGTHFVLTGSGFFISGNYVSGDANSTAFDIDGSNGIMAVGNEVSHALYAWKNTGSNTACFIESNIYNSVTTQLQNPLGLRSRFEGVTYGHLRTGGSAPSIAVGVPAGTGASASVVGNDNAGTITLTTGTGATSGTVLFTLTWAIAREGAGAPRIVLFPANAVAATNDARPYNNGANSTQCNIGANGTPSSSATYKWDYHVIQA